MFCFRKPSPVAQAIIDSLDKHPEKWSASEHRVWIGKDDGLLGNGVIEIWIANKDYGLRLEKPGFVRFLPHDRKHIWRAFKKWQCLQGNVARFLELLNAAESHD